MSDRTLPLWLRLVLLVTGLMQAGLGITLLLNPGAIEATWPWPLTPLEARLLGASSLVSVPLSILTAAVNRWSAARIPLVMLITYRVLQVAAGIIHYDRFDFRRLITWNYFGGGTLLMLLLAYGLLRGPYLGQPTSGYPGWLRGQAGLALPGVGRWVLRLAAAFYFLLGFTLLVLGASGAGLWFEAPGRATALTLRLFASPTMGLALGMWLITRAACWREAAVPAIGMVTIGLTGSLALLLETSSIAPPTPFGWLVAATPPVLLLIGAYLLLPARARGA